MKSFILVTLAFAMFACTSPKTASTGTSKVRNVASYEENGITNSDAEQMQFELDVNSSKGPATYSEMLGIYTKRLNEFRALAENSKIKSNDKKILMLKQTDYAERQIKAQTHGKGFWYDLLMSKLNDSRAEIRNGNFSAATGITTTLAKLFAGA